MRVLFRAPAGPRTGFGHLVRCRSLARALGTAPFVSVRGTAQTRRLAASRGWDIAPGGLVLLDRSAPDLLVVDDPSPDEAGRWVRAAQRRRVPVATLHDLGLGFTDSDLAIDGSLGSPRRGAHATLAGPAFTVLDPEVTHTREDALHAPGCGVLVALGGGSAVRRVGPGLAEEIARVLPHMPVRIAGGFTHGSPSTPRGSRVTWVHAPDGLAAALRESAIVVSAGGLTLYEAAALGRPAVALAVVAAQRPTIAAFARRGAAVDAGFIGDADVVRRVVDAVAALAAEPTRAAHLGASAARVIDGRGVFRVADALRELAAGGRRRGTHAA